ncbi:bacterioferritin-associated ferredoxin [Sphingobium fontiphilum]|uniref:Bacterioferritin-associated ferredoxin n=1 Tax=Sphingobium fontiphilum TaxID=944425 RepID=A0A7W6DI93_9SPHN|nr:bacterioferritin-associated ferredoxin [Sphingobium fontiphilum]
MDLALPGEPKAAKAAAIGISTIATHYQIRYLCLQEKAMVVCVCNAIREKDLKEAVRDGADTPCSAYARFGRRPKCGQCVPFARTIIAAERASA